MREQSPGRQLGPQIDKTTRGWLLGRSGSSTFHREDAQGRFPAHSCSDVTFLASEVSPDRILSLSCFPPLQARTKALGLGDLEAGSGGKTCPPSRPHRLDLVLATKRAGRGRRGGGWAMCAGSRCPWGCLGLGWSCWRATPFQKSWWGRSHGPPLSGLLLGAGVPPAGD